MLNNLKLVLFQHKRFLFIFLLIVFVPSIILAFFGIQAIQNERYKLQQINLEQQRGFVRALKAEVQLLIEKEVSALREFSTSLALIDRDYQALHTMISERVLDGEIQGQIVIWKGDDPAWFPGLAAKPPARQIPAVPAEWRRFQPDLKRAERSEFRLRNFSQAVTLYRRILQRAKEDRVRAWILSRIARCEVKNNNYKQALEIYHLMIEGSNDLVTESGRPLGIVTRMEILDVLLAEDLLADFFQESLQTFKLLENRFWSLDTGQIEMYSAALLQKVDDNVRDNSLDLVPANYQSSISRIQDTIARKLQIQHMAEAVRINLLPKIRSRKNGSPGDRLDPQKNTLGVEGKDIMVLLLPLASHASGIDFEFLGSLLEFENLSEPIDTFILSNTPPGISVLFRSNLSDTIHYGIENKTEQIPIMTGFFSGNFPPWKLEVYYNEGTGPEFPLYKNIFFWIILALVVIVFFGSGLIIRSITQEVNLLNLKSEFIASVSHEFKTPLTAMGAILERLMDDEVKDSKKIREYYRILSHDSDKLKRLVKNILDFTKIEDGKQEYKLAEADIAQLVRKEVDSFQEENKMAGFIMEMDIGKDIPLVSADEEALRQAFHNILDNAVKFSGQEKKIAVKVSCKKDRVEIAVQDRGVGIPENEQSKVFEKFYRGKKASSISPTGTGLGLTLVKHIMGGHGGSVVIQSKPGKGSCVSLILPLAKGG